MITSLNMQNGGTNDNRLKSLNVINLLSFLSNLQQKLCIVEIFANLTLPFK